MSSGNHATPSYVGDARTIRETLSVRHCRGTRIAELQARHDAATVDVPCLRDKALPTQRRSRLILAVQWKDHFGDLTVPEADGDAPLAIVGRERPLAILEDKLKRHGLVWIHGPPGAGKSMLAASYRAQAACTVLWFSVERGDQDLATFFLRLRNVASTSRASASELKLPSPLDLMNIAAFARNFFRCLFDTLDGATVLLFDNYQNAGELALDGVTEAALAELPARCNLIIVSRHAPSLTQPKQQNLALTDIGWPILRLTLQEAIVIAANSQVHAPELVDSLHRHCEGWAAGFAMLLGHAQLPNPSIAEIAERARASVFRYFTSALYEAAPLEIQRLLLDTALLPSFSRAQAAAVTSPEAVDAALTWLQQRNYFIDRREDAQLMYRYNAMFREFLLHQAYERLACLPAWPVRIYTLGRFSVLLDDRPVSFSAKAQAKPLELLRILIALGGRSVQINAIMIALWPDEGAAARAGFDVTLMRLRKLLRHADVLILADGKLSLNERISWVDCWVFERAVTSLREGSDTRNVLGALDLYRGAFLARELDIPCVVNARDRLAGKFQHLVLQAGRKYEQAGDWHEAARIYLRGLEQDNIREEFYRRLILCQWHLGERVEAIKTYRRCRDLLSINLGAKPSSETETLYRRLASS